MPNSSFWVTKLLLLTLSRIPSFKVCGIVRVFFILIFWNLHIKNCRQIRNVKKLTFLLRHFKKCSKMCFLQVGVWHLFIQKLTNGENWSDLPLVRHYLVSKRKAFWFSINSTFFRTFKNWVGFLSCKAIHFFVLLLAKSERWVLRHFVRKSSRFRWTRFFFGKFWKQRLIFKVVLAGWSLAFVYSESN